MTEKKMHMPGKKRPEDYLVDVPSVGGNEMKVVCDQHIGRIFKSGEGTSEGQDVFNDELAVSGDLTLIHKDKDGNIKSAETLENVICYVGLKHISLLVTGAITTPFRYIQIGTGGRDPSQLTQLLPPDPANTKLVAFYKEGLAVVSNAEVLNNADRGYQAVARFAYTFDFTEEVHINEACISVDSQTVLDTPILNRRTFYDRVMQPSDFLEVVWEVAFTRYPKDKVT